MPTKQVIRYRAKIKELLADVGNLKEDGVKAVHRMLDEARKRTIGNLFDAVDGSWESYHLPRLQAAVGRAMYQFARQYRTDLLGRQSEIWRLGQQLVDSPLDIMGVAAQVPEINLAALEIAQAGTADLVGGGLVPDLVAKVNYQIQLGLLGEKTPFQIMQSIGKKLTDPGPFKSIFARAETITRTELGRVRSMATSARLKQASRSVPGMMHQWIWSGIGRVTHALAHGQVRPAGEPFDVGGEKLMYPLDPAASAKNTVNCGCSETMYMEGWPTLVELNPALAKKAERLLAA